MFRSSKSMGSLGAIFSTSHNKRSGISSNAEKFSKSEETLESLKHSISDSDESESDSHTESDSDEEASKSDHKPAPTIVRKFKK